MNNRLRSPVFTWKDYEAILALVRKLKDYCGVVGIVWVSGKLIVDRHVEVLNFDQKSWRDIKSHDRFFRICKNLYNMLSARVSKGTMVFGATADLLDAYEKQAEILVPFPVEKKTIIRKHQLYFPGDADNWCVVEPVRTKAFSDFICYGEITVDTTTHQKQRFGWAVPEGCSRGLDRRAVKNCRKY